MAPSIDEIRAAINKMHARVQEETYYELLGVDEEADNAKVTTSFRKLAKNWHVDRFSQFDLGEDRHKLQEIFSTLNSAHRTLTDEDARLEYDLEISDGPSIGELLEAENDFLRGKGMLNSGRAKGAHELFRKASEAAPEEMQYRAYFLYTEALQLPKNEDGIVLKVARKRATEIYKELDDLTIQFPQKDWLMQFLGTVSLGLGREADAQELFTEALMINKNNTDAARQLRLLRMRKQKSKKSGGFFSKLFGGK